MIADIRAPRRGSGWFLRARGRRAAGVGATARMRLATAIHCQGLVTSCCGLSRSVGKADEIAAEDSSFGGAAHLRPVYPSVTRVSSAPGCCPGWDGSDRERVAEG